MVTDTSPAPILVVEDEGDLRTLIGYNLGQEGYRVELTQDLRSARTALNEIRPNLVILDLMLPDGSGIDLALEMRQNPALSETPILFVTAKPRETSLRRYAFSPRDDYLAKPFSVRELLKRVHLQVRSPVQATAPKETLP